MKKSIECPATIAGPKLTARETFEFERELVERVAQTYLLVRGLPAIAASNADPGPGRSRRWTPAGAHYVIDVEHLVTRVLRNKRNSAEYVPLWDALLESDGFFTKIRKTDQRTVSLLASSFKRNGLDPKIYFMPNRYAHRRDK